MGDLLLLVAYLFNHHASQTVASSQLCAFPIHAICIAYATCLETCAEERFPLLHLDLQKRILVMEQVLPYWLKRHVCSHEVLNNTGKYAMRFLVSHACFESLESPFK